MDAAAYERLLDPTRPVDVTLPDRRGADWWGRGMRVTRKGRSEAVTWLRGPTVLTLLTIPCLSPALTGSLGRVLRRRRGEGHLGDRRG